MNELDIGLTHLALPVTDVVRSSEFYDRYANLKVVHQRSDPETGQSVVWLSDHRRPFVLVLIELPVSHLLGGNAHIGVGCQSRSEVDELAAAASSAGLTTDGPNDFGPPVGYWAMIIDPDGHNLELSFGQAIAFITEAQN